MGAFYVGLFKFLLAFACWDLLGTDQPTKAFSQRAAAQHRRGEQFFQIESCWMMLDRWWSVWMAKIVDHHCRTKENHRDVEIGAQIECALWRISERCWKKIKNIWKYLKKASHHARFITTYLCTCGHAWPIWAQRSLARRRHTMKYHEMKRQFEKAHDIKQPHFPSLSCRFLHSCLRSSFLWPCPRPSLIFPLKTLRRLSIKSWCSSKRKMT